MAASDTGDTYITGYGPDHILDGEIGAFVARFDPEGTQVWNRPTGFNGRTSDLGRPQIDRRRPGSFRYDALRQALDQGLRRFRPRSRAG